MNEKSTIRVVFFGTPDFVLPVAKKLTETCDLVGVVTSPDAPTGRKKLLTPSPIKSWYMEYLLSQNKEGVILTPETLTEDVAIKLRKLHPDIFIVAAYGKLIPNSILSIPMHSSINIHPSLLPKYRGPAPIQIALLNGDNTLGISLIQMDQELDHGPLLFQWEIPISTSDTFASLHIKAFNDASEKLPEIIQKVHTGSIDPIPQDDTRATFTQKITKQDGYFDIDNPPSSEKLNRMIRAYYPWPTVWSKLLVNGKEVLIKFLPEKNVQLEGKKPMSIKEFLNGYPELREKLERLFPKP